MKTSRKFWPQNTSGKVSLWLGVIGFAAWLILPAITTLFGETYPVTDSWVMPTIGVALIVIAAISNVITYTFLRQRSVSNLVMLSITVFWALFTATFLIGEGLSGI